MHIPLYHKLSQEKCFKKVWMICKFVNLLNSEVRTTWPDHWPKMKERMKHQSRSNNSADNEWADLAAAHAAGDLVGDDQAGGHPAGEHRPHHVHDAGREPPRHRHPCSLSPATSKEAIPQTPSLPPCNRQAPTKQPWLSRGGDRLNSEDLTSYHRRAHLLSCRLAGTVSTQESMQVRPISARPTDSARILRTSNRQEKLRPQEIWLDFTASSAT